jgi:hypothetical protein
MVEVPGTDTGTVGGADFDPVKLRHPEKMAPSPSVKVN